LQYNLFLPRKKLKRPGYLTIDENFMPAPEDEGDEFYPNGLFVFNITKMIRHIKNNQSGFPITVKKVNEIRNGFSKINEDHINSVDVTSPIVIAEISPGRFNVIDGNHRLEKAYRMGLECISAYVLKPEQHIPFLTSIKAYQTYVKYWNSKMKEIEKRTLT